MKDLLYIVIYNSIKVVGVTWEKSFVHFIKFYGDGKVLLLLKCPYIIAVSYSYIDH